VHVGATVGLLLQDRPEEWKDYTILFPTELIPSDSVIWLRKGETDTRDALDKVIRELHANGKLLEYAKANRLLNTSYLEEEHKKLESEGK
jgi:polar amino acid transport system substrate-binding protein